MHALQRNIFHILCVTPPRLKIILSDLEEMLRKPAKTSDDLIRCYRICETCKSKTLVIGEGKVLDDEPGIVV